jgi:hypothetical protein
MPKIRTSYQKDTGPRRPEGREGDTVSRYLVQDVFDAGPFRVVDTLSGTTVSDDIFSEAEAHIITFALNAVAEGKILAATSDHVNPWEETDNIEAYDGPTEGVAP